jgi:hypothetical protein
MRRLLAVLLLALSAAWTPAADQVPAGFDWLDFAKEFQRAMRGDAAGEWTRIPWCGSAAEASAEARRTGKPLFVFAYITVDAYLPGEHGTQVCPGGRATRGTSLSDAAVIERLKKDYVCLALDCKRSGFPASMPGLQLCEQVYRNYANPDKGFSASCVLTPDGQQLLGTSGAGTVATYKTSICYDPAKFARFLDESGERGQRWSRADAAARKRLEQEIWSSVMATGTPDGFASK